MDDSELVSRLEALANRSHQRSNVARLRDVFDHVEGLLAKGFSRADVLAELNAGGLEMSEASFKSALQRIRAEQANKSGICTPIRNGIDGSATCPHCGAALADREVSDKRAEENSAAVQPAAPTAIMSETGTEDAADRDHPPSLSDVLLRGQRRMREQGHS
jgi:hypothetical protein